MSKPQQPELRRSGQVPALNPDAMEAILEAEEDVELSSEAKPSGEGTFDASPADSTPSTSDEDKPDLDDFAEAFGISEEDSDGPASDETTDQ